ncbi:MAG: cupin domain-containing protein [Chloroflexales bacterium]|nr:cupin domain-containing protein [Chloroflexales bacterium]
MRSHHDAAAEAAALAPEVADVGTRLRALREAHSLSIRALAEASGLAINTLSLIEHGKTSPSVSTLQQLAQALQVPITAFFAPEVPALPLVFCKAGQQRAAPLPHGLLADLGAGMARRTLEPLLLTLDPQAGSGSQAIVHPGQEFIYCLEGRLAYTVAEEVYLLEPGDSLLFEAALPHRWQNVAPTPVRALLVLCPYEQPGSAVVRHGLAMR